jgi:rare lipoprotein A
VATLAVAVGLFLGLPTPQVRADTAPTARVVHASYYGHEFAWRLTASGERYNPDKLSAAHRTLPLGTKLKVTNLHNGRSVLVTVNDRGPYVKPRELDLSLGAARKLGMIRRGVARVRIERVES